MVIITIIAGTITILSACLSLRYLKRHNEKRGVYRIKK